MIRTTTIIRIRSNKRGTTRQHYVRVVITGARDMNAFADSCEKAGMKAETVALIRRAPRLTMKMTPEEAKTIGL